MSAGPRSLGRRILVVGPAWVGDIVMAHTLVRVLAERDPDARIDVLTPEWSRSLVERMPAVHRVIPIAIDHGELNVALRWKLGRSLRAARYDRAIVMKRTFKSALIPAIAGIPRRTGVRGEARYGLINDVRELTADAVPLNHERYALLGLDPAESLDPRPLPEPILKGDPANRALLVERFDLDPSQGPVGFAPGAAYGPAKRWPQEHWVKLARAITERGRPVWIFGSTSEHAAGDAIVADAGPGVVNLAGDTSLTDVVDLASLCDAFVSNDSGLMHVAAAAGAYVVALFGSTSPLNTPPLTLRRTVLWRRLDCSPCFERTCPLGHLQCLVGISPAEVFDACLLDGDELGGKHGSSIDRGVRA